MRVVLCVLALLVPTAAAAQTCGPGGPKYALVPGEVDITLRAGKTLKGTTVVCVDRDKFVVTDGGRVRMVPLADVVRIVKPRDSLVNGFLIGAAIGFFISSQCGECRYNPDWSEWDGAKAGLVLGALGAGVDALRGSSMTVYAPPAAAKGSPSVGWRIRF